MREQQLPEPILLCSSYCLLSLNFVKPARGAERPITTITGHNGNYTTLPADNAPASEVSDADAPAAIARRPTHLSLKRHGVFA
ncbi:hypothetical protein EVAR_63211_1 [Eumeta japonica]|uniref:Uncharacterized protein n=1 Tax=Eumeta variegata TaxID=151549 RepID=A0A4C1ZG35_EUMVA|nr:hypothetical protein EVAR_63211_1 [Eumeta japonica]